MKRSHAFAAIGVLSLFLVPALSVLAADIDSGLRVNDSTGIVHVAGSTIPGDSELRIKTATGVTGVLLVAPTDPLASKAKINTASGVKALKKFVGAPSMPTGLATTSVTCGGNVGLSWSTSASANFYTIYRGGVRLATTTALTFADSGLTVSTSYTYSISASNDAGESALATLTTLSSASCTPSVPVISVNTDPTCGGRIIISWSAVPIATSYKIYRNGTLATTTTSISYTDTGLTVSTNYTYTVAASNAAGDSVASAAASATSSHSCAPVAPVIVATTDTICGGRVIISWSAVPTATSYKIYRNGSIVSTVSSLVFTDIGLSGSTQYAYTVIASNASGDSSTSTQQFATSSELCLPPANFAAIMGACSTNSVRLSWSAVTGAIGYKVFTDYGTGTYTKLAETPDLSYTFTGASYATEYSYKVFAYYASGDSPTFSTAAATGPIICTPTIKFSAYGYQSSGSKSSTTNTLMYDGTQLFWTSTDAQSCTGNGDGTNLFGIWGSNASYDPSIATTSVVSTTQLGIPVKWPGTGPRTPLLGATMFSLSCVNSMGTFGDNVSLSMYPTRVGVPTGAITFIPVRDTYNNPIVSYGNGKVYGSIYYGCNRNENELNSLYKNKFNSFKRSTDGITWTAVGLDGMNMEAVLPDGTIPNIWSGGQNNTPGWMGGCSIQVGMSPNR